MSINPGKYDIRIRQGGTYTEVFTYYNSDGVTAINLTGYTARMKAREATDSTSTFLDMTTANSKITLGGAAGTITLSLTAAETAALAVQVGVYDIELIAGDGTVVPLVYGNITIHREVTY